MKVVCDRCEDTIEYKESTRLELMFPWELYGRPDLKITLCGKCAKRAEKNIENFIGVLKDKDDEESNLG